MIKGILMLLVGGGIAVGMTRFVIPYMITGTTSSDLIIRFMLAPAIMMAVIVAIFMLVKKRTRGQQV